MPLVRTLNATRDRKRASRKQRMWDGGGRRVGGMGRGEVGGVQVGAERERERGGGGGFGKMHNRSFS